MLRYEIHSNVASSEQGLQPHPELDDLVRTLAARQVEVRVVHQTFAEESEVNLASSRHARGVTVRGRAVRNLPAHAHLRGCLVWLRAVASRPQRGMHAEIAEVRAASGAALLLAQVLGRNQQVFLTVPELVWPRLLAVPDRTFQAVPTEIAGSDALRRDYLDRATRPTGFLAAMQRLATLALLPAPLSASLTQGRGADPGQGLTEGQIVNIALFDEVVERYERLVEQVCGLLPAEGTLGDLPQLFELLLQGVPLEGLLGHFGEYLLPARREEATSKRLLVHELRIGLRQADEPTREQFRYRLLREVVLLRAVQDPRLYARAQRLPPMDAKRLEALEAPRASFLAWLSDPAAAVPATAGAEAGAAPPAIRIALFELMVNLAYQGRFAQSYRPGSEPLSVQVARQLLNGFSVRNLDQRQLQRLNPALPTRGVARALAAKVAVTVPEVQRIQLALWTALFPLGRVAGTLHRELAAREAETRRDSAAHARTAFLQGGHRLLRATNYVLGQTGGEPLLRQAALAAGHALGQTVLASRDQIHRRTPAAPDANGLEQEAEGYQLLMTRDDARWFPLRAPAAQLAGAYLNLVRERIAESVRRLIAKKLSYLVHRHGTALFAVIHDHVVWNLGLLLTRAQLATVLLDAGVFDGARLHEFGFHDEAAPDHDATAPGTGQMPEAGDALEDPLLQAAMAGTDGAQLEPFLGSRSEARCRAALKGLSARIEAYGAPGPPPDATPDAPRRLIQALATLAAQEHLDLRDPVVRKALEATREADALTQALQHLLAPHEAALATLRERNDALELPLSGPWALLAMLREHHTLTLVDQPQHVRLVRSALPADTTAPASASQGADDANGLAAELALALTAHVSGPAGKPLAAALTVLQQHQTAWQTLLQAAMLPLLDQQLRETVLRIAEPARPLPRDLKALAPGRVLCVGASAHDQARFSRVVERPEHPGTFVTLSELTSRLAGFNRLREEFESYREVLADLREVVAGLNLSIYDAPYVRRYLQGLEALDATLAVRPEEFTAADLSEVEAKAQALGAHVRTSYERERTVPLRDRWMNRIAQGLRRMHPTLHLTFVDALHEQTRTLPEAGGSARDGDSAEAGGAGGGGGAAGAPGKTTPAGRTRGEDHQTFAERVRRTVAFRERMDHVRAIVLAPNNTQQRLALTVIDTLYRLKGVHTPTFVDIAGCESFVDALHTRIPAHRLFDMNAL